MVCIKHCTTFENWSMFCKAFITFEIKSFEFWSRSISNGCPTLFEQIQRRRLQRRSLYLEWSGSRDPDDGVLDKGSVIFSNIIRPQRIRSLARVPEFCANNWTSFLFSSDWKNGRSAAALRSPTFSIFLSPKIRWNFSVQKCSSSWAKQYWIWAVPQSKLSVLAIKSARTEISRTDLISSWLTVGRSTNSCWVKNILQQRSFPTSMHSLRKFLEIGTESENIVNSSRMLSPIGTVLKAFSMSWTWVSSHNSSSWQYWRSMMLVEMLSEFKVVSVQLMLYELKTAILTKTLERSWRENEEEDRSTQLSKKTPLKTLRSVSVDVSFNFIVASQSKRMT